MDRLLKIMQRINKFLDALVLVFSETKYIMLAFILAMAMAFTYPLLFPIAIGAKISLFVFRGSALDIIILAAVSVAFGMTLAMQIYQFRRMSVNRKTGVNLTSTILGVLTSKACCILPLIFLASGATAGVSFFVKYTNEIRLLGLLLLTFSMYLISMNISRGCCNDGIRVRKMNN